MNDGDSCYEDELTTTIIDMNGADCEVVAYLNGVIMVGIVA